MNFIDECNRYALKNRLANYKCRAEWINNGVVRRVIGPIHDAPVTWKQARKEYPMSNVRPEALKKPIYSARGVYANKDIFHLDRFEDMPGYIEEPKEAHKCINLRHTGWYTDDFQDNLLSGVVIPIRHPQKINPGSGSHIFYLAGTKQTNYDGVTVYLDKLYECEEDAARRADRIAEREAEDEREADEKYRAEQKIEELKAEYHTLNAEARQVIKDARNASGLFPASICKLIECNIKEILERKRDILCGVKELTDMPWMISEYR